MGNPKNILQKDLLVYNTFTTDLLPEISLLALKGTYPNETEESLRKYFYDLIDSEDIEYIKVLKQKSEIMSELKRLALREVELREILVAGVRSSRE